LINKIAKNIRIFKRKYKNLFPFNSKKYWENRYSIGLNSGEGSYQKELKEFKSNTINEFLNNNTIKSIIEYGCGDGNQIQNINYENYLGFDVSETAIKICKDKFSHKESYNFEHLKKYNNQKADLSISLDVIFHLIEDEVFEKHMNLLFNSSNRYVIIYSSNTNKQSTESVAHYKNRKFTDWINENIKNFQLINIVKNTYPYDYKTKKGSVSDFYIYRMIG